MLLENAAVKAKVKVSSMVLGLGDGNSLQLLKKVIKISGWNDLTKQNLINFWEISNNYKLE